MIKLSQPSISEEAITRVNDVLRSGQLVHGEECDHFEQELSEFIGVRHAMVVASGTAALHLSLLALDIGPGDAVLIPDFTFVATANVVAMVGAKPVIVDVDVSTYNMDIALLEERIASWSGSERLRAIMPVLEFGNPAHLREYRAIADRYGLYLIEDAACAIGSHDEGCNAGSVGDFGCFSFHPRKTLTTGEGGLVTTNDNCLAERVKLLRNHGMLRTASGLEFKSIGLNYRMTNFQAAIGRIMLKSLPLWLDKRKKLAFEYHFQLEGLEEKGYISRPNTHSGHTWQTYMVILNQEIERNNIIPKLRKQGVEASTGAQSISSLKMIANEVNYHNDFYSGRKLYESGLAIPLHENMSTLDIKNTVNALYLVLKT